MEENNNRFDNLSERLDNPGNANAPVQFTGAKSKKSSKTAIIIIAAVVVIIALLGALIALNLSGKELLESDYIAVIDVNGEISSASGSMLEGASYNHSWTINEVDSLIKDKHNKGIFMRVDSPGGSVITGDELYYKLKEYQEKTGRPVYTYMGSMAASGGYYISANTDKILANRNCWTGSIGVTTGTMYDFTGLMEKLGIKAFTITSGKNKSMGSSFEEMTDEQKQIMQDLIDEAYEQFLGVVCEGRNLPEEDVRPIADGRILSAQQALDAKLIDGICTEEEALQMMIDENSLDECEVEYLAPETNTSILSYLEAFVTKDSTELAEYKAILELIHSGNYCTVSYMCDIRK